MIQPNYTGKHPTGRLIYDKKKAGEHRNYPLFLYHQPRERVFIIDENKITGIIPK